ncbi:MAG TPA: DUF222 domain-containing protein, partial [Pseudonocardiaceae bacterium]|nr:DUF222 domain-containing protein [Pseudonocardiaceae bacterium]
PARLSDAELIDAVVGFDRLASWALARQARLLAEFARRRPADSSSGPRCDEPLLVSEFACDEVGLALRLSRSTATARLTMAETLVADLPGTLAAWETGVIDTLKARAITEASYLLPQEQRAALEARVLPRAGQQTVSRLRAALARAVLAIDPDGAEERYHRRRQDRRVVVSPDEAGMASLWALLSAPDATAAYQRLGDLARGLGAADPRGMDARRADLLVDLLTGRRCAGTGSPAESPCPEDCDCSPTESGLAESAPAGSTATEPGPAEPGPAEPGPAESARTCQGHGCGAVRGGNLPATAPGSPPARASNPPARPGKPLISVIVPITMLLGLDEQPGELVGHGPIPASLAREIAADGTWRRLLTDPASGTLLDYGRTTYTPPAGLAEFVRARDVYCRNPICGQRAGIADLDHAIAWNDGGTTCEHNLQAFCRRDHLIKTHTPGWQVDRHPDGRVVWTTPTGHTYTSCPYNYHPDPIPHPPPAGDPHLATGHEPPRHDPPHRDPPPF